MWSPKTELDTIITLIISKIDKNFQRKLGIFYEEIREINK